MFDYGYKCPFCWEEFPSSGRLVEHMTQQHPESERSDTSDAPWWAYISLGVAMGIVSAIVFASAMHLGG